MLTSLQLKEYTKLVEKTKHQYILKVKVGYSEELLSIHNELSFMVAETKTSKVDKLVPNHNNKKKYVICIQALEKTWGHELMLKKVYIVYKIQSVWHKTYIDLNAIWRTQATNEFEEDLFKLINNSFFGKTLENIHNHKDIRLVSVEKKYLR